MACRTSQIHQTTVSQQKNAVTIREIIAVYLRLDVYTFDARIMFQRIHLDFIIKVADVTYDRLIFHFLHVVNANDIDIPRSSHEDITFGAGIFHRYDFETFHSSLQRTDRIDFRHKHTCTIRAH